MPRRFSASSAAMQMACHASADLGSAIPNWVEPDPRVGGAADKGTAAHSIFELVNHYSAKEMQALIRTFQYVADLRSTRRFKVLTEVTASAEWLDIPENTTADLVLHTQDELHILDLKWGTIPVDPIENHQLLYYGVTFAPLAPKAKGVHLHILQPRIDNMDVWFADTARLSKFMADARAAQAAILAGDTSFGPSDHCTFCPANPHSRGPKGKPLCPAMMKLLYPPVLDESEILNL